MTGILISLLIWLIIYLVLTDRFFIAKKNRSRNYSNQNTPRYKPLKQYEVKSKSVTYLPSEPKKEDLPITPKLEEKPKKEATPTSKKQRGYSREETELRRLVKDDGAVDRLIISLIDKFPDRSRNWCADKALGDWLRDRQ